MIPVKPPPEARLADDADGGAERISATAHFGNAATRDQTFTFRAYKADLVKTALNREFGFKCAYCETYFGAAQPVAIEHYRPKSGYLVGEKMKKPGYYWLAAAWDNLLPSCTDCNSERKQSLADGTTLVVGKANQFPITSEPRRARRHTSNIRNEGRLLLHPYHDRPDRHLLYTDGGIVTWQLPGKKPSRKGKESIRVYALLRDGLVRARAALEKDLKVQMTIAEDIVLGLADNPNSAALNRALDRQLALLESYTRPDRPYSQMGTQILESFLRRLRDA